MADNTILNLGSGGDTIASDDIGGGVKVQRVKIMLGADGANDGDVSSSLAIPTQELNDRSASATLTNVSGAASSTSLLASNANRKGARFFNDSSSDMYIKFGTTASTSSFSVKVNAGGYYNMEKPIYTGAIDGIWDSAAGAVRITEM